MVVLASAEFNSHRHKQGGHPRNCGESGDLTPAGDPTEQSFGTFNPRSFALTICLYATAPSFQTFLLTTPAPRESTTLFDHHLAFKHMFYVRTRAVRHLQGGSKESTRYINAGDISVNKFTLRKFLGYLRCARKALDSYVGQPQGAGA
jgi:hypothetical protein